MKNTALCCLLTLGSLSSYAQTYAPETGGTGYIQNQTAANQAASFRINGTAYINTNPAAYTNTLRGFIESANYRSGLVIESSGSINYGTTGADASGFAYRWLSANSTTIDYATNAQEVMRLSKTGSLGIGTASPAYKLDVNGNARILNALYVGAGIYYGDVNNLAFFHNGGYVWANMGNTATRMTLSAGGDLAVGGNSLTVGGKQVWHTGNFTPASYMPLTGGAITGDVTIGTTPVQKELAVNGTIKTRKITVTQTNWPDYVFDSSYRLAPLQQVEKYIQENKHLPEIPAAATVNKEGVNLGDNQALLLKKIEELTLYIISQHKEIQELKREMNQQKEQIKALSR